MSEMEMKMIGKEDIDIDIDIDIGKDLTPSLPPLSYSLYDSFLSSHCSSCFRPLTTTTTTTPTTFLNYCSNDVICSTTSLHFSSGEHHLFHLLHHHPSLFPHHDTSDLRAALRLLHHHHHHHHLSPRLFGLLTNRTKILSDESNSRVRVKDGARVMAMARAIRDGRVVDNVVVDFEIEEALLCLVITNSVEIQLNGLAPVGIGVYDWRFSWINHSCSPNLCYRFVNAWESDDDDDDDEGALMRIEPRGGGGLMEIAKGNGNYAPRIKVRSIRVISRGEEVTITYTDLLQPTAIRQADLLKFQFMCNCRCCRAVPQAYVDQALQENLFTRLPNNSTRLHSNLDEENYVESLKDVFDSTIEEYMEIGNPVSCSNKIETLLSQGLFDQHLEQITKISLTNFKLSPLHHLSLSAYTTLYSTYKIRSGFQSIDTDKLHSFDTSRISAAYSLLLAGAAHHLFFYEPSLIASTATFWLDAGEALLYLAKSSSHNNFAKCMSEKISTSNLKCCGCSLMDKFESNFSSTQTQHREFDDISREFIICVSVIIPKVWKILVHGCQYLEDIKDPIDFNWLGDMRTDDMRDLNSRSPNCKFYSSEDSEARRDIVKCDDIEQGNEMRTHLFQLGIHCLLYGYYLSCICYGHHQYRAFCIRNMPNC